MAFDTSAAPSIAGTEHAAPSVVRADHLTRFRPGVSGNPSGKPIGSRNRLQGDFMRELSADFAAHGRIAIKKCRTQAPSKYLAIIASLMPKDVNLNMRPLAELTDDDIRERIAALRELVNDPRIGSGLSAPIEGESTREVPAIPEATDLPRGRSDTSRALVDGRESGR